MTAADDARRARQRVNSAAYRARQKSAAQTKKPRGAQPHGGGVVRAAQEYAERLRGARDEILSKLPDVRNPAANIRPMERTGRAEGPPVKTKSAQAARAKVIRDRANAERLRGIGRARKNSLRIALTDGPISEQLQEMNPDQRRRFRELTERISRGSAQSIAILFEYADGQKLYGAAIDRILYELSREEGFDMLETLAEYAEDAARLYAPTRIGALNV